MDYEVEQKCVNCKYWSLEAERICMNEESDKLSQFCDRNDSCEKWVFVGDE